VYKSIAYPEPSRWLEADANREHLIDLADAEESMLINGYVREAIGVFELCLDLASLSQDELHAV
jgi:hypothetical protein